MSCFVTVAVYDQRGDASRDWKRLDTQGRQGDVCIVDAALVDTDHDTVRVFMRASQLSQADGAAASAVVALLRPAVLVTGAMAGGVGETMMMSISRGVGRSDVRRLGEVLDEGRFAIIAISSRADPLDARPNVLPWQSAKAMAIAELQTTEDDILWAMLADSAID